MSEPEMPDFEGMPNIVRFQLMHAAIRSEPHDPEDMLFLQCTHRDLAVFVAGVILLGTFFPEFKGIVMEMLEKLEQVTHVQDFMLPRDRQEGLDGD